MQVRKQWTVQGDHVGPALHPFLAQVGMLTTMASAQAAGTFGFHVGATEGEVASARSQNGSARSALSVAQQTFNNGNILSDDGAAITSYRGAAATANNAAHLADVAAHTPSGVNQGLADAAKAHASAAWAANGAAAGAGSRDAARGAAAQAISEAQAAISAADSAIASAPVGITQVEHEGGTVLGSYPANVVSAAQAAQGAMSSDPNYCKSVGQSGSRVNAAVHNFKAAWNVAQTPKVPVGTGKYEASTADALGKALGEPAMASCDGAPAPKPSPPPAPVKKTVTCPDGSVHPQGYECPKEAEAGFFGDWGIWALLGVGLAGGYWWWQRRKHGESLIPKWEKEAA